MNGGDAVPAGATRSPTIAPHRSPATPADATPDGRRHAAIPMSTSPIDPPPLILIEEVEAAEERLSRTEIGSRATRGALSVMVRGFAVRGIGLLGNIVLARLLLPKDFGMVALGNAIVVLGQFIADGGLGAALVRQEGTIDRRDLRAMFGAQAVVTALVAAAVSALAIPLGEAVALGAIMTWSLVIDAARSPNTIPLERQMQFKIVLQGEIVETIVWNAFAVVAVLIGLGVWGVALAQIVRAVAGYLWLTVLGPTGVVLPLLSWSRARRLLGFGMKLQGTQVIAYIRDQGLTILIAAIAGFAALGTWTIVYRLVTVIVILMESLWRVSYPAMSRLRESGEEMLPAVERALSTATIASGFLVAPLAGAAPALVPVLFGPRWHAAVDIVPVAVVSVMLTGPILSIAVGYLLAEGRATVLVYMSIVDGVATWGVGLPVLAAIGIMGVAIGQAAAGICDLVILTLAIWGGRSFGRGMVTLVPTLVVVVAAVPAWLLTTVLGDGLVGLIVGVISSEIVYATGLFVVRRAAMMDVAHIGLRTARSLTHAA